VELEDDFLRVEKGEGESDRETTGIEVRNVFLEEAPEETGEGEGELLEVVGPMGYELGEFDADEEEIEAREFDNGEGGGDLVVVEGIFDFS
jgi:hypothetical protein